MMSLQRRWDETTHLLGAAARELAAAPDLMSEFEAWLANNELELALDALEGAAAAGGTPQAPGFWSAMRAAALSMGLSDHAARYGRAAADSSLPPEV